MCVSQLQQAAEEKATVTSQLRVVSQTLRDTQTRCQWLEGQVQGHSQVDAPPPHRDSYKPSAAGLKWRTMPCLRCNWSFCRVATRGQPMLRWHLEPPRREATPPWVGKEQKPIS